MHHKRKQRHCRAQPHLHLHTHCSGVLQPLCRAALQVVGRRALDDNFVEEAAEAGYNKGANGTPLERPALAVLRALLLRLWDSFELPPNPLDGAQYPPRAFP